MAGAGGSRYVGPPRSRQSDPFASGSATSETIVLDGFPDRQRPAEPSEGLQEAVRGPDAGAHWLASLRRRAPSLPVSGLESERAPFTTRVYAVKRLVKGVVRWALRIFSYASSPFVALVARTGWGADQYLKRGVLPVAVHYYQPIFDPATLPASVWDRRHAMPGVDFRPNDQLGFLEELGRFGNECDWPEHPLPADPTQYYWGNGTFGYSSACLLHSVIRRFKPSRVI